MSQRAMIALAIALGIFGSIDMNRNDYQSGWDTDQFPNNVPEVALALYYILRAGGLGSGGFNFDVGFDLCPLFRRQLVQLLEHADQALYRAKDKGRNQVSD